MSIQAPPRPSPLPRPVEDVAPTDIADGGTAALTARQITTVALAAALAAFGGTWMAAGVFEGALPRIVAALGPLAGAGLVALSYRARRPAPVQYAILPAVLALAAVVVSPSAALGEIPALVRDALFSGGIGQPPVAFDPGWRFLLVILGALVGATAAAVSIGFERPKLAAAIPVPLVVGAALVQPAGAEVVSTAVALVAVVGALSVAYGVDLARSGVTSGGFEAARLARGALAAVGLATAVVALANLASFLLPQSAEDRVVPPQRPQVAPAQEDRELFRVDVDRALPWRVGVLDVYADGAWMLPPFDPARLIDVPADGALPGSSRPDDATSATVTLLAAQARSVPMLAAATSVVSTGDPVQFDPRTGTLRFEDLPSGDVAYTVTAAPPASAETLLAAGPIADEVRPFLEAPAPPPNVTALLADAPVAPLFERLQFVRQRYYEAVIASGPGDPVDVSAARVGELLGGQAGSPYEISAGEALLARWAGVPARIGFGYYAGDAVDGGGRTFRPRHGATWLEVWFDGAGWVPIVGKPPRAQASLSDAPRNADASVRPTDQFALVTYVPVRRQPLTLLFETVRWWAARAVPAALAVLGAVAAVPSALRSARRWRRQRWARGRGAAARLAVAYADLREQAWDLNIGHPTRTPLEFTADLDDDDEHRELAWLVTRALWGDLSRDLSAFDASQAEEMAASVTRRLRSAQPAFTRLLASASWASLREPFSDELPGPLTRIPHRRDRTSGRGRPRLVTTTLIGLLAVVALIASGCTQPLELDARGSSASALPDRLTPAALDELRFQRERDAEAPFDVVDDDASLVDEGRVFTIRRDDAVEASLQIVALRPGLEQREDEVRDGILRALGGGRFEPRRIGEDRVQVLRSSERQLLLWFSPDGRWYQLLVARRAFEESEDVFAALLAYQRGEAVDGLDTRAGARRLDPQRGIAG